jgi:hypothetical protein
MHHHRARIPQWFSSAFVDALGRRHGFSAAGMREAAELHADLLKPPPRRRGSATCMLSSASTLSRSASARAARSPEEAAALEELIGTSLVLAFLQVTQLATVVEIAARRAAAAEHFGATRPPAGQDFDAVATTCISLLSPGILNGRARWWQRARLFRLVFSQRADGAWDVCDAVAFALEARTTAEVTQLAPSAWERLRDGVMTLVGMVVEAGTDDADDLARTGFDIAALQRNTKTDAGADRTAALAAAQELAAEAASEDEATKVADDPLRCSLTAVVQSVPRRLVALHRTHSGSEEEDVDAKRVWATLCCIALLKTLSCCWLWTDGCAALPHRRLLVVRHGIASRVLLRCRQGFVSGD